MSFDNDLNGKFVKLKKFHDINFHIKSLINEISLNDLEKNKTIK